MRVVIDADPAGPETAGRSRGLRAATAAPRRCRSLEGQLPVVAGAADLDHPELPLDDLRPRDQVGVVAIGRVEPARRARRERARRELVERIGARTLDLEQLREVAVAGEEDHAFDLLRDEPVGERALLGAEVMPALEAARALPELAAAGDDLDAAARRRNERLLQPFELPRSEHRLVGAVRPAVRGTVVPVVEQEEHHVAVTRRAERAGRVRQAEARIRPVASEKLQRLAFQHVRRVAVVGTVVVVVPDRKVRRRGEQMLQRRERALPAVARRHRRGIEEIGLLQVEVVAQPQHQVRFLRGDRVEDLVAAAVVLARPARIGIREEEARADRERQRERLGSPGPVRLRPHRALVLVGACAHAIGRGRGGLEPGQARDDDALVRVGRGELLRALVRFAFRAPAHRDRRRGVGLDPQRGAGELGGAVHDHELRGRRARRSHAANAMHARAGTWPATRSGCGRACWRMAAEQGHAAIVPGGRGVYNCPHGR